MSRFQFMSTEKKRKFLTMVFLFSLVFSFFVQFIPIMASAENFGTETQGGTGSWSSHTYKRGCKFNTTNSINVTTIYFYTSNTNSEEIQVAIYEDNSGAPSDLVANSSATVVEDGWNEVSISIPSNLTATTPYWLYWQLNTSSNPNPKYYYDSGDTNQLAYVSSGYGSWPDPISTDGYLNQDVSIYASDVSGGGAAESNVQIFWTETFEDDDLANYSFPPYGTPPEVDDGAWGMDFSNAVPYDEVNSSECWGEIQTDTVYAGSQAAYMLCTTDDLDLATHYGFMYNDARWVIVEDDQSKAYDTFYVSWYMNFERIPVSGENGAFIFKEASKVGTFYSGENFVLKLDNETLYLNKIWDNGTYSSDSASVDFALDTWYFFETEYHYDQTEGYYKVWVDQDLVISATGLNSTPFLTNSTAYGREGRNNKFEIGISATHDENGNYSLFMDNIRCANYHASYVKDTSFESWEGNNFGSEDTYGAEAENQSDIRYFEDEAIHVIGNKSRYYDNSSSIVILGTYNYTYANSTMVQVTNAAYDGEDYYSAIADSGSPVYETLQDFLDNVDGIITGTGNDPFDPEDQWNWEFCHFVVFNYTGGGEQSFLKWTTTYPRARIGINEEYDSIGSYSELYQGAYMYWTQLDGYLEFLRFYSTYYIARVRLGQGTATVSFGDTQFHNWDFYNSTTQELVQEVNNYSVTISLDEWHWVEARCRTGTETTSGVQVWVDGDLVIDVMDLNGTGVPDVTTVVSGLVLINNPVEFYEDEWKISQSYIGAGGGGGGEGDTYTISLTITNPQATTYTSSSIPVSLSTGGNDTSPTYSWNAQFSNATWLYGTNQTSSSTTMTINENQTDVLFACLVTGSHGTSDYGEVTFNVSIITAEDTYTLTLSITNPQNTTYSSSSIPVNLGTSGNDTNPVYSWNTKFSNGTWLYGSNQTSTSTTMTINENQTNVLFACYVIGDNGANDYGEVYFTVTIIDTYTISLTITNPQNTTYTTSTIAVSLSTGGNDTSPTYSWNFQFSNGTWLYGSNQTSSSTTMSISENSTGKFACKVTGTYGSTDYGEVYLTVQITISDPVLGGIITDGMFNFQLVQGSSLSIQSPDLTVTITLTIFSGNLNGTGVLTTDTDGGTLRIMPWTTGSLIMTSNDSTTIFYINGLNHTGTPYGFGAAPFNITFGWTSEPTLPDNPFGLGISDQIAYLTQYLWNRDFVGFIIACYTNSMGQWFYLIIATIVAVALYLKIKNIMVLGVAWLLTGGVFIPLIPEALPIIIFCWIIGAATVLYKMFHHTT